MNETQAIVEAYRRVRAEGALGALATVVRVEGSAYRRPGARMFIPEKGPAVGVLSGGCLERDVCERAGRVMRTGEPVVVRYDTTTGDDIVWGLGLGCNGVVQVLIEPAAGRLMGEFMQLLSDCSRGRERGAAATVFRSEGGAGATVGERALLYPDGSRAGSLISPGVAGDMREAATGGTSKTALYESEAGEIEVFVEALKPPVPLVIFGAGHDALPLVSFAKRLGWHTTVVDTQARAASLARFAEADAVMLCRPEEVGARSDLWEGAAVVLMTHNYLHDRELLKTFLSAGSPYIGCLGPKRRAERMLLELLGEGLTLGYEQLCRLHAPVGLDVGAETSEEIALSIVAEITSVLRGRGGGHLRSRKGPIHADACQQEAPAEINDAEGLAAEDLVGPLALAEV